MIDSHPTGCACAPCRGLTPAEAAAATSGEQGPDAHELEVAHLRELLAAARAELAAARAQVGALTEALIRLEKVSRRHWEGCHPSAGRHTKECLEARAAGEQARATIRARGAK